MHPLRITKLDDGLPDPTRAHHGDAGIDLHTTRLITLQPGQRAVADTGIAVAIPHGHAGMVCPRSGLAAKHGITVVNAPGIIDSGYRGEIKVILLNTGTEPVAFARGDRIAQLLIVPIATPTIELVDDLGTSDRGDGGLGSTGT